MKETSLDPQFGNYYLRRILGEKGLSRVYLGEHVLFHTPVAIKLIDRYEGDELTRFVEQATLLTRLKHPHIVPILDFGVHQGAAYLVMQYMPQGDLRQRHPRGTMLPLATVVDYTKNIAGALQHVHTHHLVHRDVKPHNMLLGDNEEIMLSDFGIAVPSHSLDDLTTYDFEGTAPYAAPEQLRGDPRRASDQYALAIVVYEWLSGNWPFTGNFEAITRKHFFAIPPPFKEHGITIAEEVEQVIMKALAKEPEQRFASVLDFAEALEQANKHTEAPEPAQLPPTKRQFMSPRIFTR